MAHDPNDESMDGYCGAPASAHEFALKKARSPILPLSTKAFWCQNNPREAANEIERLREALRPFAAFAERSASQFPDDLVITAGSGMARKQLTLGDCRAAYAAFSN